MARKAVGLLGLNDPNSIMGVSAPLIAAGEAPGGLISSLMKLKKTPAPAAALMEQLSTASPKATVSPALDSVMGGRAPAPSPFNYMLNRTIGRVPEAAGKFEPISGTLTRAPGLATQYADQAAFRGRAAGSEESRLMKDMLRGIYERPSVTSLDQLGDITMQPKTLSNGTADLIGKPVNGAGNPNTIKNLVKAGLTQDQVRSIRGMSFDQALKAFPETKPGTLQGIIRGDTFGWIQ